MYLLQNLPTRDNVPDDVRGASEYWANKFHYIIRRWQSMFGFGENYVSLYRRLQAKHGLDENNDPITVKHDPDR